MLRNLWEKGFASRNQHSKGTEGTQLDQNLNIGVSEIGDIFGYLKMAIWKRMMDQWF